MRALRSEWLKLVTTRTAWALIGAGVLLEGVAVGLIAALIPRSDLQGRDVSKLFGGIGLMTVFVLTLGALVSTNEYRHRTANSTFLITPVREYVVGAKLAVGFAAGLIAAACFGATNAIVSLTILHIRDLSPSTHTAVQLYTGTAIGIVLSCMFGVALGAVMRNQILTVVVGLIAFFVLRGVALLIGGAGGYFPAESLAALQGATGNHNLLSQVSGGFVFAGYCVVLGVVGMGLTRRREIT
jgi:hypothetical protein